MKSTDYEPGRVERNDGSTGDTSAASGRNGPSIALIAFLIVAALAVWFFATNSQSTEIDFLVAQKTTTVRWSLLIAVVLGVVLDRLLSVWWRRMRRRR